MYYLVYRHEPFLKYLKASFVVGLSLLIFYRLQPIRVDQTNGFWLTDVPFANLPWSLLLFSHQI